MTTVVGTLTIDDLPIKVYYPVGGFNPPQHVYLAMLVVYASIILYLLKLIYVLRVAYSYG